jgi:hypothetical protein
MAQPEPEDKTTLEQVLKLVHQLSADEQEQLVRETIKLQELRRELMIGVEQLERGEKIPGEQVFREIRERHKGRMAKGK